MKKLRKLFLSSMLALTLSVSIGSYTTTLISQPSVVYASGMEDSLGGNSSSSSDGLGEGTVSEDDIAAGNYIKGQRGFTGDQLNNASKKLSPLTNIAGYLVGAGVVLLFAFVFVITILDLLYIAIPPIRTALYKGGAAPSGGAPTGGMMGGGYGMRGGMMGGMMGGAQGGVQGGALSSIQWISDEAVQCAALTGGAQQQQQGGMMGGGMMGGAMGGNMGMPQQMPTKSVIGMYFKKRIVFMILLAVSAIVLTSSVLLGTGVNLAQWIVKMLDGINNSMPV